MSGTTPTRGITPGLPTNTGSFRSIEKEEAEVTLTETEVPSWFVPSDQIRQTSEPLTELNLQNESRVASEVARLVGDGLMAVDAPYQRPSVWTQVQRSRLVESWIRGVPVPPITVNNRASNAFLRNNPDMVDLRKSGRGSYTVIDGKQRAETAVAWFNGEFGVPASWFPADEVETPVETPDGPYVTYDGLSQRGQRVMHMTAKLPWQIAHLDTVEAEADLYVLLNTGGTDQTAADIENAASYGSSASA